MITRGVVTNYLKKTPRRWRSPAGHVGSAWHHGSSAPPNSDPNLWIHLSRPSRRAAGPGKRHPARGTPRAQPRDVRSAGRDTWNLTGEALGGPRKRSWRWCSRARSGRRSAIRGAHSGALDRPEPSDRAPRSARDPLTLRPTPASALLQPGRAGSRRGRGARWARRGGSARAPRDRVGRVGRTERSARRLGLGRSPPQAHALC